MTPRIIPVILCAALIGIAGCAHTAKRAESQALLPEIDIVQMKENSDEALRLAQEAKLDVEAANTKLTEIDNKLVLLNEDVSAVSIAKIEELENRLSLIVEALKETQTQMNAMELSPRAQKKGPTGPATFSPSSASSILNSSPETEAYQNALEIFNARNYKQAEESFGNILKQYPQGRYADNCQYWIGECGYALADYAQAIAAFQKVFNYSNSSKADDAQLKIGLCYLKMGQKSMAKSELEKLMDRYPSSEYSARAKKYLVEME
jgi:tol-pal system protein YbgF